LFRLEFIILLTSRFNLKKRDFMNLSNMKKICGNFAHVAYVGTFRTNTGIKVDHECARKIQTMFVFETCL